eukprot:1139568-Pelagomonas_calceolata.AAC.2
MLLCQILRGGTGEECRSGAHIWTGVQADAGAAETHWPGPSAAATAAAATLAHWEGSGSFLIPSCRQPAGAFFTHTPNTSHK